MNNSVGTQLLQSSEGPTNNESRPDTTNRGTHYRGLFFLQKRERFKHIPDSWILLDSQSTASVFKTRELLTDIKSNGDTLLMVSNGGGQQLITETGHIHGYGRVWFNKNSLANILSLADVRRRGWRITMDTAEEAAMTVHRNNGTLMKFKEYSSGLYFFDTNDINNGIENYCLVQTVEDNERKYHRREVEGAKKAIRLRRNIGRPSHRRFLQILQNHWIRNNTVTVADAVRAVDIYGKSVPNIKGETTKRKAEHHPTHVPVEIAHILKLHKDVTLCIDVFWVQGIPFYHSISRKIDFRTCSHLTRSRKNDLLEATMETKELYENRMFKVVDIHADKQFECIKHDVPGTHIEITAPDDHVHEAERSIRTMKNGCRSNIHGLPYKYMPKIMIV